MTQIEKKHDDLQLAVLFKTDKFPDGRDAILRAFQRMVGDYVQVLLSPETDDATALQTRAKAIGLIEAMSQMGLDMTHVMEKAPIQRAMSERVRESLGIH